MTTTHTAVWPVLTYVDAHAAIDFLTKAFGFEARACHTRDGDPTIVEHAEMRWPLGGGVMFGTAEKDDGPFGKRVPGNDSVYVVCDDPDVLFDRAATAGAEVGGACATRTMGHGASRSAPRGQPLELRHVRRGVMAPAIAQAPRHVGSLARRSHRGDLRDGGWLDTPGDLLLLDLAGALNDRPGRGVGYGWANTPSTWSCLSTDSRRGESDANRGGRGDPAGEATIRRNVR